MTFGNKEARDIELTAASERYFDIKNLRIAIGRPFTGEENRSGVPVAVLGDAVAKDAEFDADQKRPLADAAAELTEAAALYRADREKLLASVQRFGRKYGAALPDATAAVRKLAQQAGPVPVQPP